MQRPDGGTERPAVCLLVNTLQPAGAEGLLLDVVERAADRVTFTVCHLGGDDTLRDRFEAAGATVHDLRFSFPYDPRGIARLVHILRGSVFNVLNTHLPPSMVVGRAAGALAGVPVISTHHTVPEDYGLVSGTVERLTRRLDARTVAVSEGVADANGDSDDPRWSVIYNGIDVEAFADRVAAADGDAVCDRHGVDADRVLLNVGRYESAKGQTHLIDAMARVVEEGHDAHLFVVGFGSLESELTTRARRRGIEDHVTVTGRVPAVEPYYAAADGFVLSSLLEGFGIVLLEAMAAALPVVATDIRGVREVIVDGETGRLVPPGDGAALADAMATLCVGDIDWGAAGRARAAETFDISRTADAYVDLYRSFLE